MTRSDFFTGTLDAKICRISFGHSVYTPPSASSSPSACVRSNVFVNPKPRDCHIHVAEGVRDKECSGQQNHQRQNVKIALATGIYRLQGDECGNDLVMNITVQKDIVPSLEEEWETHKVVEGQNIANRRI